MNTVRGTGLRAVLDTNVLISAFTHPRKRLAFVWRAAQERQYRLLISRPIAEEVAGVLRVKFAWEQGRIIRRLKQLIRAGELIAPQVRLAVVEDQADNRILECAVEGRADLVVSGDRDLLQLKAYQGIAIVRPADFLRTLGVSTRR